MELTPQDLYDNPTLAALTDAIVARHAAGGLASQDTGDLDPAVPPNILRFLDGGLAEPGRWRAPLVLTHRFAGHPEDVETVMTAVINHHDALRMKVVNRAGMWEQHISESADFTGLTRQTLPAGAGPGSPEEREALSAIVSGALVVGRGLDERAIDGDLCGRRTGRRAVPGAHHSRHGRRPHLTRGSRHRPADRVRATGRRRRRDSGAGDDQLAGLVTALFSAGRAPRGARTA